MDKFYNFFLVWNNKSLISIFEIFENTLIPKIIYKNNLM